MSRQKAGSAIKKAQSATGTTASSSHGDGGLQIGKAHDSVGGLIYMFSFPRYLGWLTTMFHGG